MGSLQANQLQDQLHNQLCSLVDILLLSRREVPQVNLLANLRDDLQASLHVCLLGSHQVSQFADLHHNQVCNLVGNRRHSPLKSPLLDLLVNLPDTRQASRPECRLDSRPRNL